MHVFIFTNVKLYEINLEEDYEKSDIQAENHIREIESGMIQMI